MNNTENYKVKNEVSNYQDIKVKWVDESICCPTHTIKEVSQREPEWHVFYALSFYNLCLFIMHTKTDISDVKNFIW